MTTLRRHPTNEVFGLVDKAEEVEAIVLDVRKHGVDGDELHVLDAKDARTSIAEEPHGLRRAIESLSEEHEVSETYQDEVEHGHRLVGIPLSDAIDKETAQHILEDHGAHHLTYYGSWVVEELGG